MPDATLRRHWAGFFGELPRMLDAFAALLACYRAAGRYYHTIEHGLEVARTARSLGGGLSADQAHALHLAAWAHDAHYEPGRADNEARSADLAMSGARTMGFGPEQTALVGDLVLASTHTIPPRTELEMIVCDADLAVLAKPWPAYRADVANIRAELAISKASEWKARRLEMLDFFDRKQPLFHLATTTRQWERQARWNQQRERELLTT